ncbi:hypothetical protein [Halomonas chromatireducens]|uniref:Uncharacterized protein n=1 Tax=Halomonas chromatireducens TaxID=507626 RepID=A0A0X8HB80_9GAMM|nr:hypothetical protein [Halomonas chromatireducens]AMC99440.1 hypothetical protein LOKO_00344 [Halomonas chromatireducens]
MAFSALSSTGARWTTSLMGGGLLVAVMAPASADPLEERMPPGMLIEMVDPTLCSPPPEEMSDAEIIAMLDSDDPQMAPPIVGAWERQDERWRVYGQGWFNDSSSGLVVGTMLMLRSEGDELQYLCMVLSPHAETAMVEGEAALVGPDVETIDGDTFMAMGILGERREGLGEVLADAGSVHFEQAAEDTLEWRLTFDGRLTGIDEQPQEGTEISLRLEGELSRDSSMRVVDWGRDDLVDASAPSVSEEELAEVKALFMEDMRLEVEPVVTPDNNDIVQRTVYRYDYDTFASLSDDSGWRSTREHFFYQDGDRLRPFQRPSSDTDLSAFFGGLLDPGFVLDEATADDFRELLMTLTGEDFFEEEDVKLDNIINFRPDEWIFFTGTFFDHYKAFVVYTDDDGHPDKVLYRLKQQPTS